MMTRTWRYNPTGFVFDEQADTVCRIAARSDQDEIGTAIAQVPAMVDVLSKLDEYAQVELEAGGPVHYPGLVEEARAILREIEGEK